MPWVYKVSAHTFYLDGVYQFDAKYSGRPGYKDDSANECIVSKGPIPRGTYTIGEAFYHHKTKAYTMRLTPFIENQMCGRDGFMIHGNSAAHPWDASDGCIILDYQSRKTINSSTDKILVVED
ncbi:tlde1 domain-containing protein [Atlantibacter sp.]|uniref:tlde1 domain-containing protein n=1 Tax=Atlantibacter sp. TaxID=1903473 RepID=UPI0028AF73C2|nr:tlde1 domain-containing protein [Atlantibacter sp.]